jgi:hypothetical protein
MYSRTGAVDERPILKKRCLHIAEYFRLIEGCALAGLISLTGKIASDRDKISEVDVTAGLRGVKPKFGAVAEIGPSARVYICPCDRKSVFWSGPRENLNPIDNVFASERIRWKYD